MEICEETPEETPCPVCLTDYSASVRKAIACVYCHTKTCLQCMKIYVLENASNPKCMHCQKLFTTDFIDTVFTRGFRRGDLRKQRIANLVELEKSLMPQTSLIIERRRVLLKRKKYADELRDLCNQAYECRHPRETIDEILEHLKRVKIDLWELVPPVESSTKEAALVRHAKCPKCPGFIPVSLSGKCRLCDYEMCRTCGDEKQENHVCNPDSVLTLNAIKSSATPCPECGTYIDKVSGCNQMFCTACHTPFDYRTGRKVSGPIHNPHYFEFVRQNGGALGGLGGLQANDCAGAHNNNYTNMEYIYAHFRKRYTCFQSREVCTCVSCPNRTKIMAIFSTSNWITELARPAFREYTNDSYLEVRIKFLEGKITEKMFATQLSALETRRIKHNRILEVNKMFSAVSGDLIAKFRNDISVRSNTSLEDFCKAMENLRVYTYQAKSTILQDYSDDNVLHPNSDWGMFPIRVRD